MENELLKAISEYVDGITMKNFSAKYDGLAAILIDYNERGMGKDAVMTVWESYWRVNSDTFNDWQDEVVIEVDCRLNGFCTPLRVIHLKP